MATPKWDRSGLKEASQRALKLGRTHQETDIQLFLDMLLKIEQLEDDMAQIQQCDKCDLCEDHHEP